MEPTNKQRRIPADYAELYSFNVSHDTGIKLTVFHKEHKYVF